MEMDRNVSILRVLESTNYYPTSANRYSNISFTLQDEALWKKFNSVVNEMIVTKSGRRMFPIIRVAVDGLDPQAIYNVKIEFRQVDTHRWKYMNGDWVVGGKAEPAPQTCEYAHPETPNYGSHWMKEPISFFKVKLTNKPSPQPGQVVLNSLHKYEPRIKITREATEKMPKQEYTFDLPETRFIAVTAYQNEEVTQLKIRHNPFAKAFQDTREQHRDRPEDIIEPPAKRVRTSPPAITGPMHGDTAAVLPPSTSTGYVQSSEYTPNVCSADYGGMTSGPAYSTGYQQPPYASMNSYGYQPSYSSDGPAHFDYLWFTQSTNHHQIN